jgi:hypothetical protein
MKLLPIKEVAETLDVPVHSVRKVAAEAGLLLKLDGLRIEADRVRDLLDHCRLTPGREV